MSLKDILLPYPNVVDILDTEKLPGAGVQGNVLSAPPISLIPFPTKIVKV